VSLLVPCPHCGERPYTEFTFGGELRPIEADGPEADFAQVYLRENAAGPQAERWYHEAGCKRWLTLTRDTVTNTIER